MKCTVSGKDLDFEEAFGQVDQIFEIVGTVKILVSFLQIFTSLQLTMTIPWADSFINMMKLFRFISTDLFFFF